jgi:uncharacterized membrane protein YfcA
VTLPVLGVTATEAALLAAVGLVAGVVNTVAGAGSLLSLRALMLLGLPADVANGTNRVAVLVQSTTAARGLDPARTIDRASVVRAVVPSSLGALAGAIGASLLPERVLRWVLIVVLLGVAVTSALPTKKAAPHPANGAGEAEAGSSEAASDGPLVLTRATTAWLFVAGAYGGFLQAGVGLVLLFALGRVAGLGLVRANALKAIAVACFTLFALAVFVARGQVAWGPALAMSAGAFAGAKLGVAYALRWSSQLKVAVVVADVVACVVLVARELAAGG